MRHRYPDNVVVRRTEHRIARGKVSRKVDDVASTCRVSLVEVGMLNNTHKRKFGIVDVHPVELGKTPCEFENDAHISKIIDRTDLVSIGRGSHVASSASR